MLAWLRAFFAERDFVWKQPEMFTRSGTEYQIWPMMIRDMAAARAQCDSELLAQYPGYLERTDPQGRRFDIPVLRHTFCTELARAGCRPELLHRLARHSKAKTTLAYYPDLETPTFEDLAAAVAKLPRCG